jgi:nucleotide-binding universal stress UspA family protein
MVVIDASAKSRLHRLLTGSLPDKVVRGSGVPVLLAPEKLGPAIH